jgi:hypothetical protein
MSTAKMPIRHIREEIDTSLYTHSGHGLGHEHGHWAPPKLANRGIFLGLHLFFPFWLAFLLIGSSPQSSQPLRIYIREGHRISTDFTFLQNLYFPPEPTNCGLLLMY